MRIDEIAKNRRMQIYDTVFDCLIANAGGIMPTPLESVCNRLGIGLVPLSVIASGMGISSDDVKARWQNENGQLTVYRTAACAQFKIAYNDSKGHRLRRRFTIAEELSHYLLEHYHNKMYAINGRALDYAVYDEHEAEARFAAGIILCPPAFYYQFPALLNCAGIRLNSNVSSECAANCTSILRTYHDEITGSRRYAELFALY